MLLFGRAVYEIVLFTLTTDERLMGTDITERSVLTTLGAGITDEGMFLGSGSRPSEFKLLKVKTFEVCEGFCVEHSDSPSVTIMMLYIKTVSQSSLLETDIMIAAHVGAIFYAVHEIIQMALFVKYGFANIFGRAVDGQRTDV